jgi:hypothetical protein
MVLFAGVTRTVLVIGQEPTPRGFRGTIPDFDIVLMKLPNAQVQLRAIPP